MTTKHSRQHRWQQAVLKADLNSYAKHVGLTLSTFAKADGSHYKSPSNKHLARCTSLDVRTVRKAVGDLLSAGLIAKVGSDRWGATVWWLIIPEALAQAVDNTPPPPVEEAPRGVTPRPRGGSSHDPLGGHPMTPHPTDTYIATEQSALTSVVDITARRIGRHLA